MTTKSSRYFVAGQEAARAGNHWLSSCPCRPGWQAELWKDGVWSINKPKELESYVRQLHSMV